METRLTNVDNWGGGKGLVIRGLNHAPKNHKSSLLSEEGRERQRDLYPQGGSIWRKVYFEGSGCQCLLGQPWLRLRGQRSCSLVCPTAKLAFWNLRHSACSLHDMTCSLPCRGEQVVAHFCRPREGSESV